MRDRAADGVAEREQEDLADDPERRAKDDVADGPPVVERPDDEEELRDDVDDDAGEVENELEDPEASRLLRREAGDVLEGTDRDQAGDESDDGTCSLQDLREVTVSACPDIRP